MKLFRAGGSWHITDMRRGESIFELDPYAQEEVGRGFELDGSNLSGVSGRCSWSEQDYFSGKDCKDVNSRLDSSFHQSFLGKYMFVNIKKDQLYAKVCYMQFMKQSTFRPFESLSSPV